ncbi:MAG: hypothetical protein WA231_07245 [Methylocella sp.]
MEHVTKGARTRTRKLRQSQVDRVFVAVLASAAPVPERLGFCKLRPAFVASWFKLSIENHRRTLGSRVRVPKRGFGSFPAADFRGVSNIVPGVARLRGTRVKPDILSKI